MRLSDWNGGLEEWCKWVKIHDPTYTQLEEAGEEPGADFFFPLAMDDLSAFLDWEEDRHGQSRAYARRIAFEYGARLGLPIYLDPNEAFAARPRGARSSRAQFRSPVGSTIVEQSHSIFVVGRASPLRRVHRGLFR